LVLGSPTYGRCVFFQDVGEINGTQVPFTIGIQTLTQCEPMLSYGHNGAISMDANTRLYLILTFFSFLPLAITTFNIQKTTISLLIFNFNELNQKD
jgi:hypothetical protein